MLKEMDTIAADQINQGYLYMICLLTLKLILVWTVSSNLPKDHWNRLCLKWMHLPAITWANMGPIFIIISIIIITSTTN